MNLSDKLKQRRLELDMTLEEVGNIVGVSKSTVQKWETGDIANMRRDKITLLAKALKVSPLFIMGMDEEEPRGEYLIREEAIEYGIKNIKLIPIVGVVRAGQPILAAENVEGYFPIDKTLLNIDKEYFFLKVKGDSMDLEFKEGSLLLVEKTPCVENGEIGVILVNSHEATVKKIVKNDNMITLIPMSSNTVHTPQMIDLKSQEIQIIGKVKMAMKEY